MATIPTREIDIAYRRGYEDGLRDGEKNKMLDVQEIADAVTSAADHGNPVSRIKVRVRDWDNLLVEIREAGAKPLTAPDQATHMVNYRDTPGSVGLICGVPVLLDDTLDPETRFVIEYDAR